MRSILFSSFLLAVVPYVAAHGHISDPPARQPGTALQAACGMQVFNTETGDPDGNVQQELQAAQNQKDYDPTKCMLTVCKGYQFADNSANVQTFTAGQVVPLTAVIKAPHTGNMNVSVLNTQTGTLIGDPLIQIGDYASTSHPIPANNTNFSVTMPDVAAQCGTAGVCALQWNWDAPTVNQTYQSCVDFTMGGAAPASRKRSFKFSA